MKKGVSGEIIRCGSAGIRAVENGGVGLDEYLDASVPADLRRSVSHLLFCYFRHKRFLDGAVSKHLSKPPRPEVLALLRAATAQIYFQTAIAPESMVNVAVDAAKKAHAAPLVNAILHKVIREKSAPPETAEGVLPPELFESWRGRLADEELNEAVESLLTEPLFSFRVCGAAEPPAGASALPGWGGFRFFAAADAGELLDSKEFRRGDYYIQDPATSLAVSLPDYTQVGSALDLCAAPGGKTLMLWERLAPGTRLAAADRSAKRQRLTRENCERHGVKAEVICAAPDELEGSFDLVLADVPCGNSGVFRRRPDAMWRYSKKRQGELSRLQSEILDSAAKLTAPGGQLVYATCSIEPEENEANVAAFLKRHSDFIQLKSRLLLPALVNDGAFAALLARKSDKVL